MFCLNKGKLGQRSEAVNESCFQTLYKRVYKAEINQSLEDKTSTKGWNLKGICFYIN